MPRTVRCPKCGLVQMGQEACKKCGSPIAARSTPSAPAAKRAPALAERSPYQPPESRLEDGARAAPSGSEESIFDRDRFLLRQRVFTIQEKYEIWDEEGRPILFVERPGHYLRNLSAIFGGLFAGVVVAVPFFWATERFETVAPSIFGVVAGLVTFVVATALLSKKRHVHFYRDDSKRELLLEVLQDQKLAFLTHTFTVNEPGGRTIARLQKNMLTDLFRKKWSCAAPDGRALWEAKEDSILLAIVRRFFTRLVPLCFIFCLPGGQVVGEFNRKFTLLDRYVLDLSRDAAGALDRRVAVAMGVMLDTGERR
ncbi:MAG TPA: zinc ribbon domain-containing protein [Vicinamibacteria bacterium]|nr:zinc ribbon domain-containing protein [Vicinamibacteria bacterium]